MAEGYKNKTLFERTSNGVTVDLSSTDYDSYSISSNKTGYIPLIAYVSVGNWGEWVSYNANYTYSNGAVSVTGNVHKNASSVAAKPYLSLQVLWMKE